jgi:hypothetical protein
MRWHINSCNAYSLSWLWSVCITEEDSAKIPCGVKDPSLALSTTFPEEPIGAILLRSASMYEMGNFRENSIMHDPSYFVP